jgi:hypothetical protein
VAELALKRPDSKFMIVEHSAAYINELISKSLVTRFFPSETLVATARGNPSWEKICFSKLESWKKAGKRILFFETPESFRVPGAMELKSKLRNIMNSA